jgi:hypothetical protein
LLFVSVVPMTMYKLMCDEYHDNMEAYQRHDYTFVMYIDGGVGVGKRTMMQQVNDVHYSKDRDGCFDPSYLTKFNQFRNDVDLLCIPEPEHLWRLALHHKMFFLYDITASYMENIAAALNAPIALDAHRQRKSVYFVIMSRSVIGHGLFRDPHTQEPQNVLSRQLTVERMLRGHLGVESLRVAQIFMETGTIQENLTRIKIRGRGYETYIDEQMVAYWGACSDYVENLFSYSLYVPFYTIRIMGEKVLSLRPPMITPPLRKIVMPTECFEALYAKQNVNVPAITVQQGVHRWVRQTYVCIFCVAVYTITTADMHSVVMPKKRMTDCISCGHVLKTLGELGGTLRTHVGIKRYEALQNLIKVFVEEEANLASSKI